jgi:hypothetical protein
MDCALSDVSNTWQIVCRSKRNKRSKLSLKLNPDAPEFVEPPSVNLPSVNLPSVNLPSVNLPSVNLPSVNLPSVNPPHGLEERPTDVNYKMRVSLARQARQGIIKTAFECTDIMIGIHAKSLVSDMAMNPEKYFGIDADELMFIQTSLISLGSSLGLGN